MGLLVAEKKVDRHTDIQTRFMFYKYRYDVTFYFVKPSTTPSIFTFSFPGHLLLHQYLHFCWSLRVCCTVSQYWDWGCQCQHDFCLSCHHGSGGQTYLAHDWTWWNVHFLCCTRHLFEITGKLTLKKRRSIRQLSDANSHVAHSYMSFVRILFDNLLMKISKAPMKLNQK